MSGPLIALVDYGMGNLRSVEKALEKVGGRVSVTDSPRIVRGADAVVLPGVGAFGQAARRLKKAGLRSAIEETLRKGKPFLGICLGLQLLFEGSEEDPRDKGLGFFKGRVVRFRDRNLKVPHMGWNTLTVKGRLAQGLEGIAPEDRFYFVHSYFPVPEELAAVAATTFYGRMFCSAASRGNVLATQFHPEKSGKQGLGLLKRFIKQVNECS